MKTPPIIRPWTITRIVEEKFQVMARSKKEALAMDKLDPFAITVKKETATKS